MSTPPSKTRSTTNNSLAALVTRLVWLILGPVGLFVLAAVISKHGAFSPLDAVFAVTMAAVLFARYADVHRFHGKTAEGAPLTMRDVRTYARGLLIFAVALWGGAHLAGQVLLD